MKKIQRIWNKINTLTELLKSAKCILIMMQDNPDPDSIASALGLRKIANEMGDTQCTIAYGGTIGRAENRALVKYLNTPLHPFTEINLNKFNLICMVDTQPGTGNNSLPTDVSPDIVIDHHPIKKPTRKCKFTDIRQHYGATSTIICEYLKFLDIKVDTQLSTALLYGIRSDTQDLGREATKADMDAIYFLYPWANKRMLGLIQKGKVQRQYFQVLTTALQNAYIYQNKVIITNLGYTDNPDMVSEIADLLLREDDTICSICYGYSKEKMILSMRSSDESSAVNKLMSKIVTGKGTGGGHRTYAGGQVSLDGLNDKDVKKLEKQIMERILKTLDLNQKSAEKLVYEE